MNRDLYKERIKEATDRLVQVTELSGSKYGHGQAGIARRSRNSMPRIRLSLKPRMTEFIAESLSLVP